MSSSPTSAINPVHRSDESGTTENFTDYLSTVAPDVWTFGAIEVWAAEAPAVAKAARAPRVSSQAVRRRRGFDRLRRCLPGR